MSVVVIILIGVRVVVVIIITIGLIELLLLILHHYFVLLYGSFCFIKFNFTLNFCNFLFGSVALFYFILQGIKYL